MNQDWEPVVFRRTKPVQHSVQHTPPHQNFRNRTEASEASIDQDETARPVQKTLSREQIRMIQQGRSKLKMTQKALATRLNVKAHMIADIEAGRAIYDDRLMGRLERILKVILRGKNIGNTLLY